MTAYDAIVIWTGQTGPYVTSRLAGAGMNVAVIERNAFGGTCVNTGCIPTKTIELVSIVSRVSLVLLFSLVTMGCSNFFFFKKSQPPVTQRELPKRQTEPIGASTSDRLRDDVTRGARPEQALGLPSALQPAQAQEKPQPQGPAAAPAAVAPVQNSVEPDPRAVIDWLLKDRR